MASAEQLKTLRVHHDALTRHERILKDHSDRGTTLLGEEEASPILEELGRLELSFPDLVPRFEGRAQRSYGLPGRYYNTARLLGHLESVLSRLTIEISEKESSEVASLELETRDALTHVFTRGAFNVALNVAFNEATREHLPLSLVFGDIDHFKRVNDTHGHQAGDAVLRQVARVLERVAQGRGRVYRYGGEEFCLILLNHSVDEALAMAERARREIEAQPIDGVRVSMSFGVACCPDDAADIDSLVRAADEAHYDAKGRGRNLVRRFGEPPPTRPGPREPERKPPAACRLTETQRTDLRRRHLQGERIRCPDDGAILRVVDVTTTDSGPARRQFAIHCPDCGLVDELRS
jgi:diguanylate cyclase (GGDEF)-like protein